MPPATERILILARLNEKLPIYSRGMPPLKIVATNILILTEGALAVESLKLQAEGSANEVSSMVAPIEVHGFTAEQQVPVRT